MVVELFGIVRTAKFTVVAVNYYDYNACVHEEDHIYVRYVVSCIPSLLPSALDALSPIL